MAWCAKVSGGLAASCSLPSDIVILCLLTGLLACLMLQQQVPHVVHEGCVDVSEFLVQDDGATPDPGTKRTAADAGHISSNSDHEPDPTPSSALQQPVAAQSPQFIFCSRTHSQLSQFVGELHRTRFANSIMLVAVGSRKALCVNDEVSQRDRLSYITSVSYAGDTVV